MRNDIKFHNYCKKISGSVQYDIFMIIVTLLNGLLMGIEVEYAKRETLITLFRILNEIFTGLYTFEFILKLYVESYRYFKNYWNIYDVFILVTSYLKLTAYVVRSKFLYKKLTITLFSIIRGIRMFRIIHTVSFLKELKIVLLTLVYTLTNSVLNVVIVTVLVVLIFSVVANAFYQESENWRTLGLSVWTLFRYICCDEWPEIQKSIDHIYMSRVFTVFFVFIGNFIFANIFVGLIINNISDAQEKYKNDILNEKKKLIKVKKENISRKQIEDLNKLMKKDKTNNFNIEEFKELLVKYRNNIKHEEIISTVETSSNISWLNVFYKALSCLDNSMMFLKNAHYEMGLVLASIMEDRLKNTTKND
jgi:hypothetical protein